MLKNATRFRPVVAALVLLICGIAFTGVTDAPAYAYVDGSLGRAMATAAVARSIDAGISFVQGTEVSATPLGMGVTVAAGEALDPVNDLVERFSTIMLAAVASLAIQQLLATMAAHPAVSWGLAAAGMVFVVLLLARAGEGATRIALRAFLFMALIRFGMALAAGANAVIYEVFLDEPYQASHAELTRAGDELEPLAEELGAREDLTLEGEEPGWLDGMTEYWQSARKSVDPTTWIDDLEATAGQIVESTIQLIALFLLQTVALPIAVLWLLARAAGGILRLY
jgi:hypothetical protein